MPSYTVYKKANLALELCRERDEPEVHPNIPAHVNFLTILTSSAHASVNN